MKRSLTLLLAAALLLPLAACRRPAAPVIDASPERVDAVWSGAWHTVGDVRLLDRNEGYSLTEDAFHFAVNRVLEYWEDGSPMRTEAAWLTVPLDGGEPTLTEIPRVFEARGLIDETTGEYRFVLGAAMARDGTMAVAERYVYRDKNSQKESFALTAYAADGTKLYSVDPQPYWQLKRDPMADLYDRRWETEFNVLAMAYGKGGTLYLLTQTSVIAVGADGARLYETQPNGSIQSMRPDADGTVWLSWRELSDNTYYLGALDDASGGIGERRTLPAGADANSEMVPGPGGSLYYQTPKGLYAAGGGTDGGDALAINWINSDIDYSSLALFVFTDAETLAVVGKDPTSGRLEFGVLHPLAPDAVPARYLIRLAGIGLEDRLAGYMVKFNRQSDTYRVVAEDYCHETWNGDAYEAAVERLTRELLAGQVPDILYFSQLDHAVRSFDEKGLFADLYALMAESGYDPARLMPVARRPFERDGKLALLPSSFTIGGFIGRADAVGKYAAWTADDFLALLADAGAAGKNPVSFLSASPREAAQEMLIPVLLDAFSDAASGRCDFANDRFVRLLTWLGGLPTEYEERGAVFAALRSGETLTVYDKLPIENATDYLKWTALLGTEEIELLGVPGAAGGALLVNPVSGYGIADASPVKAGAWSFLETMFGGAYDAESADFDVRHNARHLPFPAVTAEWEADAAFTAESYFLFELDGSGSSGSTSADFLDRPYSKTREAPAHLSEEMTARLRAALDEKPAMTTEDIDPSLKAIFADELAAFYAGAVTAEETARRLEDRVTIWLSERR